MAVTKGLFERVTIQLLVSTFTGALKAWWDNLGDLKNVILNPPPNSSTPAFKLIEVLYKEFVGSSANEQYLLQEAFNRAELCDLTKTSLFLKEMRTLLYKLGACHSAGYKLALIHKFPKAISKLILDVVNEDNQLEQISMGELFQIIEKTILDMPQHNDVIERMNHSIVEKIRSMLSSTKLPKIF